jgi:phosphoribosylformylglycinamidine cyclo-ligase
MLRTFNCGVGLVAVTERGQEAKLIDLLAQHGERAFVIGRIEAGEPGAPPRTRYQGALSF